MSLREAMPTSPSSRSRTKPDARRRENQLSKVGHRLEPSSFPDVLGHERSEGGNRRHSERGRVSLQGENDAGGQSHHHRRALEQPVVDLDRVEFENHKRRGKEDKPPKRREPSVEGDQGGERQEARN